MVAATLAISALLCDAFGLLIAVDDLYYAARTGNNTVYAKGYTDARFRSIRLGMTAIQVEATLGPPLKIAPFGGMPSVWYYTDQETDWDNFWRRWVVFERGRVVEIISDFWTG